MRVLKHRFNRYLLFALGLLILSGSATFFTLVNSKNVMAADRAFSDIAVDHPVYQLCRHLIEIGAVKPYPDMTLAPFEKISAADWNHALIRIGEHFGRVIPNSAKFESDREISGEAIVRRLQHLVDDECRVASFANINDSRLSAYFILEHCLLDYNE
ncbi:MAG: hypothetical protein ACD_39C00444G0003 [uncultured bacterium]|nr:MAG: hypothetical protein ACD_39C00444G0003 [uncultured bacterium]